MIEEEQRKMQESILSLFNKKDKKKTEEALENMTLLEDIQQLSIDKDVEKKVRSELDQIEDKDPKVEVPMCNYGPGCRCNPELPKDIFDQIEGRDEAEGEKKEEQQDVRNMKRKKRRRKLKTAFEFNVQVDFHEPNSNFYQLLSSEDEGDSTDESSELDEQTHEETEKEKKDSPNTELVWEQKEDVSEGSFISEHSDYEDIHELDDEVTIARNDIKPTTSEAFEDSPEANVNIKEEEPEEIDDNDSDNSFIEFHDDVPSKHDTVELSSSEGFILIENPTAQNIKAEPETKQEQDPESGNEEIMSDVGKEEKNICLNHDTTTVKENNFMIVPSNDEAVAKIQNVNSNSENDNDKQISEDEISINMSPVLKKTEEQSVIKSKVKNKRIHSARQRRIPGRSVVSANSKNISNPTKRPLSASVSRTRTKLDSGNECKQLPARNCKDIMSLLLQEESFDMDLKANWDRRTPGGFRMLPEEDVTITRLSPLPSINSESRPNTATLNDRILSPRWTRASPDKFFLEEDKVESLGEQNKWIRSSTPANTLPSLNRHM